MALAIVVLAAGHGTRFGSLKQLAPLGPAGEALLDYTLYDAAAAGFSRAVLVVAPETVAPTTAHLRDFAPPLPVALVVQPIGDTRRSKPWGTAHATLVGATGLASAFAVANADDAYGAEAIATMASFLGERAPGVARHAGAVIGYSAAATLSANGGVSRAVCRVDAQGQLLAIEEHTGVRRAPTATGPGIVSDSAVLDETTPVSMNLWGFQPSFVELLRPVVERFVATAPADEHELRLPDVVGDLVAGGALRVAVLPTTSTWLGVTYPDDAPAVRQRLVALAAAGVYPTLASHRGRA
ncbi:MAG TPA: NTP transferase domain-containing protein [Acidimicrobiia bacterium]